jgi:Histidine kinase-, DNA gyrase B-, and HSP90-like ATPase
MIRAIPQVDPASEFFEIASDFRDPRDAIREAVSNAFDAKATNISIDVQMRPHKGEDELVLQIEDDGQGMNATGLDGSTPTLEAFFSLGHSTRRGDPEAIGMKGHGTKTYFNSRSIEVTTWREGSETYAVMEDPRSHLAQRQLPPYDYETKPEPSGMRTGTRIVVSGYNRNQTKGPSHEELRDFVLWWTKFGSVEKEFGLLTNATKKLSLGGLGRQILETVDFGHKFPLENFDIKKLRQKDPVSPTKNFVKKWVSKDLPVKGFPHVFLSIVFFIEGDSAKDYNPMIRRKGRPFKEGMYSVEERYGLWACKDFIAVQDITDWVAGGKRVGTKYHAFANCQEFQLTANRGDIGNTRDDLMKAVKETVSYWFENTVLGDKVYRLYEEELEHEDTYREPKQEEEEFKRRKKLAAGKKVYRHENSRLLEKGAIELIEPRQEVGVLSLFYMMYALNPKLFNFRIHDYDTKKGYDALVEVKTARDLGRESLRFVEFKRNLEREFSHSFALLAGIVCWECSLGDDEDVRDIRGEVRRLRITKPRTKMEL